MPLQGFRQFATSNVRLNAEDIRQVNVVMPVASSAKRSTCRVPSKPANVGGLERGRMKRIQELLERWDPLQLQLLPGVVTEREATEPRRRRRSPFMEFVASPTTTC
jgi:hypothetical protein